MPDPLDRIPDKIVAGDTLKVSVPQSTDVGDFSDGTWNAHARFVATGSSVLVEGANFADAGDGTWTLTLSKTVTGGLLDETRYDYFLYVENGTEEYTIERGSVFVQQDPRDTVGGKDIRSHARKVLEALEALLEGKATRDQLTYSIAGRSLSRLSPRELLEWIKVYRQKVQAEEREQDIARGLRPDTLVRTRFVATSR